VDKYEKLPGLNTDGRRVEFKIPSAEYMERKNAQYLNEWLNKEKYHRKNRPQHISSSWGNILNFTVQAAV
jgi:hypothetical protein